MSKEKYIIRIIIIKYRFTLKIVFLFRADQHSNIFCLGYFTQQRVAYQHQRIAPFLQRYNLYLFWIQIIYIIPSKISLLKSFTERLYPIKAFELLYKKYNPNYFSLYINTTSIKFYLILLQSNSLIVYRIPFKIISLYYLSREIIPAK